ncbi:MAG: thioredoxin, partial [Paramuribaculum sp.]|nr:thioredoxin [Paramuribaculum sp.]
MENLKDYCESARVVMIEFYADWCPHCRH